MKYIFEDLTKILKHINLSRHFHYHRNQWILLKWTSNFQNLETGTANQHSDVQCEMQQCQQISLLSFKLFFVRYDMDTL